MEVTFRIRQAGLLLGIAVLDHIIFNTEGYLSMMESGELL
jgi:DNA repair protein RadC